MRYVVMAAMMCAATIGALRAQEPVASKQVAELKALTDKVQNLRVTVERPLSGFE